MSRITATAHDGSEVVFGFDRPLKGYFFVKYCAPNHPKQDEDSPEIWDDWLTNGQLIDRLNQWLTEEEQARLQAPIALIAFDLDPEPGPYAENAPLQDQIAALFSSFRNS